MQKRNRGYVLTDKGLEKLNNAKRKWEKDNRGQCTEDKMRELTTEFKENGLDCGTIREIFKRQERKDEKSIDYLFRAFKLQLDNDDIIKLDSDDISFSSETVIPRGEELMSLSTKILKELGFEENFEIIKSPQQLQWIGYRIKHYEQEDNPYKLILVLDKESLCISIPLDILEPHLLNIKYVHFSDETWESECCTIDRFWVLPSKKDVFLNLLNLNYLTLLQIPKKTVGNLWLNAIIERDINFWEEDGYRQCLLSDYNAVSRFVLEEYNPDTFSQRDSYLVFTLDKRFDKWNHYKVSISSEEILKEFLDYFGKILIDEEQ